MKTRVTSKKLKEGITEVYVGEDVRDVQKAIEEEVIYYCIPIYRVD